MCDVVHTWKKVHLKIGPRPVSNPNPGFPVSMSEMDPDRGTSLSYHPTDSAVGSDRGQRDGDRAMTRGSAFATNQAQEDKHSC
jgi:hypothetical protein